jgi:hypothetical protein
LPATLILKTSAKGSNSELGGGLGFCARIFYLVLFIVTRRKERRGGRGEGERGFLKKSTLLEKF